MEEERRDRSVSMIDHINMLPDDVLCMILSFLTTKEAAATSILCRSWKYLWVVATSKKMNFDGRPSLSKLKRLKKRKEPSVYETLEEERSMFVERVDRILALQERFDLRSVLEEFRVYFDLIEPQRASIDRWVSYAISRKVERLELIFMDIFFSINRSRYNLCYNFPYNNGRLPDNFKLIKKLSMHSVSVSDEAVHSCLDNCPLLEHVSLSASRALQSLEVVGTSPSFKCLEINMCQNLKSLVLRDSSIVTLKYSGKRMRFVFDNVPRLTRLWIKIMTTMKDISDMFSPVFPQLEMLKIYFHYSYAGKYDNECIEFVSAVNMHNIKELVCCLGNLWKFTDCLQPLLYLMNAAPFMHTFVVEASHRDKSYEVYPVWRDVGGNTHRRLLRGNNQQQLKEVKFVGYRGMELQLAFIEHLMDKCVALEKLIVDPSSFKYRPYLPWDRVPRQHVEDEILARAVAKRQFKEELVPSRIKVEIL